MKDALLIAAMVIFAVFSVVEYGYFKRLKNQVQKEKIQINRRTDFAIYELGWKRGQLAGDASFKADSIYFRKILNEIYEKKGEE
jgi:hypothetical protein